MSRFNLLLKCFTDVRGLTIADEISYIADLIIGTISRLAHLPTFSGQFLLKDTLLISERIRRSVFLVPKKCRSLEVVMPWYERSTSNIIRSIVKRGDRVIDVGAHIGAYTIPIAHIVGSSGVVVAIEPSPIYQVLVKNIEMNKLENVVALRKAAYSSKKNLVFMYNPYDPLVAKISQRGHIKAEAEPLDIMIKKCLMNCEKINLLKVDVEGAEVQVLRGAKQTLKRTEHVIIEAETWKLPLVKYLLKEFKIVETSDRYGIGEAGESVNLIATRFKHSACAHEN